MAKKLLKEGWHPENDRISGLLHRNKGSSTSTSRGLAHSSTPLSSLKDPSTFGPPPKHVDTQGPGLASSKYPAQKRIDHKAEAADSESEPEPGPPPVPYRTDTSGLSTAGLPPPPTHRAIAESTSSPISPNAPSLPPRLPPRSASKPSSPSTSSPVRRSTLPAPALSSDPALPSRTATSRLTSAGISVPGFGIGKSTSKASSPLPASPNSPARESPPASGGTSFQQKRAAISTAAKFRSDPSSVSMSEAREATKTANNFRERHGDQVAAGAKKAGQVNKQYGVLAKAEELGARAQGSGTESTLDADAAVVVKKKPPPPPPKKKDLSVKSITQGDEGSAAPPPVPLASRPRF